MGNGTAKWWWRRSIEVTDSSVRRVLVKESAK
jgi:hypothetical protein